MPLQPHEESITDKTGTRFGVDERFDLLVPEFLSAMAKIMHVGASKYSEDGWKRGLKGNKSGLNHAHKHLNEYQQGVPNDYGPRSMHLAQVAVNAMFEYYFARIEERSADVKLVPESGPAKIA